MSSAPSTSFGITSVPQTSSVSAQLDRYVRQRDEWQHFTCSKLVDPIERSLRNLYDTAGELFGATSAAARAKGARDIDSIFRKIVIRVPHWSDDEVKQELSPDSMSDIDACIRMAVRAHATVMALTIDRPCKQTIKVSNTATFFRRVLVECAMDHQPSVFGSKDMDVRKSLRKWIEDCIVKHLLNLVPISLFTCEVDSPISRPSSPAEPVIPQTPSVPVQAPAPAQYAMADLAQGLARLERQQQAQIASPTASLAEIVGAPPLQTPIPLKEEEESPKNPAAASTEQNLAKPDDTNDQVAKAKSIKGDAAIVCEAGRCEIVPVAKEEEAKFGGETPTEFAPQDQFAATIDKQTEPEEDEAAVTVGLPIRDTRVKEEESHKHKHNDEEEEDEGSLMGSEDGGDEDDDEDDDPKSATL